MRFHEIDPAFLDEAFDSSVTARWSQKNHSQWTAEFQMHDQRFGVYFENLGKGWVVSYGVVQDGEEASSWTSDYKPTGQSGAAGSRVLGTVIGVVKQFLAEKSPDSLKFIGDKAAGLGSLYSRMVKNLQGQLSLIGYQVEQKENTRDGQTMFQFVKLNNQNDLDESFPNLKETSSAGSTASGNVATSVGGIGSGFDPDGDHGIYQNVKKKTRKLPVIRR